MPLACRLLGHHWRFAARGSELVWACMRCGREGGRRAYASPEEARRRARVLQRGGPQPPTGLLTALSGVVQRRPRDRRPADDGPGRREAGG